jgi:hypothetical protein
MRKIVILCILTTVYSFAQTLSVKISLAPHNNCSYGTWSLEYINASHIDSRFRGNLIDTKNQKYKRSPYYIEGEGIEIFQKNLYQKNFLKNGYYSLEWIARKNTIGDEIWNKISPSTKKLIKESEFFKNYHAQQGWEQFDWSMLLADYINSTIATLPSYNFNIKNHSNANIKIKEFYAKTIFTTGGEASPGGAYFPTQNKQNYFPMHWNHEKVLKLKKPITINPNKTKTIPMAIFVKKGAMGDGPGRLTVAIFVKYLEGKKEKEELLTIISQSEDYGYQTGW